MMLLYIAHCRLNEDHWSSELPAVLLGEFNLRAGGGGGAACCVWTNLTCVSNAVLATAAKSAANSWDSQLQPGIGHVIFTILANGGGLS